MLGLQVPVAFSFNCANQSKEIHRVKTTDKVDLQRDGTLGIGKKVIVGCELAEELEHLVKVAQTKASKIFKEKAKLLKVNQRKNEKLEMKRLLIKLPLGP